MLATYFYFSYKFQTTYNLHVLNLFGLQDVEYSLIGRTLVFGTNNKGSNPFTPTIVLSLMVEHMPSKLGMLVRIRQGTIIIYYLVGSQVVEGDRLRTYCD